MSIFLCLYTKQRQSHKILIRTQILEKLYYKVTINIYDFMQCKGKKNQLGGFILVIQLGLIQFYEVGSLFSFFKKNI